ncbi:rod-binding protein [Methylocella sp.]|uniref:rod-binding protein n=1 Tax=Methylocella sp. TaxID=1978226 RepID=UPI003783DA86
MSISPVSDIVLEVAQAADPTAAMAAAERLRRMRTDEASPSSFASVLTRSEASAAGAQGAVARAAQPPSAAPADPAVKARKGLETFFLQSVVEAILPKSEGVFGAGSSGEVWRSMFAEQIARELGKTIDLGIADPTRARAQTRGVLKATPSILAQEARHG